MGQAAVDSCQDVSMTFSQILDGKGVLIPDDNYETDNALQTTLYKYLA